MHGTEYGYILDGRIRIKVPEIKGSHEMAGVVEGLMAKLQGVAHVHANPLTGNVRVLFDSQVISYYQVFAVINDLRCLNGWASASPSLARTMQRGRSTCKIHEECTQAFREPTARVGESESWV